MIARAKCVLGGFLIGAGLAAGTISAWYQYATIIPCLASVAGGLVLCFFGLTQDVVERPRSTKP